MSDLRTAAQQALEALEDVDGPITALLGSLLGSPDADAPGAKVRTAITALRAALAQQAEPLNLRDPAVQKRLATQWGYVPAAQQAEPVEPVAVVATQSDVWRGYNGQWAPPGEPIKMVLVLVRDLPTGTLLYTAPPQRLPLTEEAISRLCDEYQSPRQLIRAIERTHGIKE